MEVRLAEEEDLFDVVSLCHKFHKEVDYVLPFDRNHTKTQIGSFIVKENVFVAEEDGEPIGFLVLDQGETVFSLSVIGVIYGIYLVPQSRNYRNAKKLLNKIEEWGKARKCEVMSIADQVDFMDLGPLFTKAGFNLIERTYMRSL